METKYRYLIPNGVTFLSLAAGFTAILAAATGNLVWSGVLILTSYILDLCDGALARRLKAGSEFGLQLDSLTDIVSLGTAPAVLAFFYLQQAGITGWWLWPLVILFPLAGAYRLARFNLLPPKTGQVDSVGLTISTAGAIIPLAVLSNLSTPGGFVPPILVAPLMFILCLLMVSRIPFPSLGQVLSRRRLNYLYLALIGTTLFWLQWPVVTTWFVFTGGYLGVSLARAGYLTVSSR
jgi:CDP-diacylglycerol---serine O-phosphatidyltransferase